MRLVCGGRPQPGLMAASSCGAQRPGEITSVHLMPASGPHRGHRTSPALTSDYDNVQTRVHVKYLSNYTDPGVMCDLSAVPGSPERSSESGDHGHKWSRSWAQHCVDIYSWISISRQISTLRSVSPPLEALVHIIYVCISFQQPSPDLSNQQLRNNISI